MHSRFELLMPSVFALTCMSVTNNLRFVTHSSFDVNTNDLILILIILMSHLACLHCFDAI